MRTVVVLDVATYFVHIEDVPLDAAVTGPFNAEVVADDRIVFEDDGFGLRPLHNGA